MRAAATLFIETPPAALDGHQPRSGERMQPTTCPFICPGCHSEQSEESRCSSPLVVRCSPSPLSLRSELVWDGKYDAHSKKRASVRIELPFQTVETVNESAQERQRTLELSSSGHDPE